MAVTRARPIGVQEFGGAYRGQQFIGFLEQFLVHFADNFHFTKQGFAAFDRI